MLLRTTLSLRSGNALVPYCSNEFPTARDLMKLKGLMLSRKTMFLSNMPLAVSSMDPFSYNGACVG